MKLLQHILSWIDSYFQTESSRRQKERQYLAAAGVKEGQIDALMKTIVPLSHTHGFDILECCKVLAQVAAIGRFLGPEFGRLCYMRFPVHAVMHDPIFLEKRVSEGSIQWESFATCICLYYDELQKN